MKIRILGCCLLSRQLLRGWRHFLGVFRSGFLLSSRLGFHSIGTVEAGMAAIHLLVYHVSINVGVVNEGLVHVRHSGVVTKRVSFPSAAPIAVSPIAMAVVNSAVKTDHRPPIDSVKDVSAIVPS